MNLQIGICTDDGRTVDKTFSVISTVSGKIKGNADIINPIFEIATPSNLNINYCYCSDWARYYYIDSIEVMQGGKVALHCRVDVLKSFSAGIKALSVIIDKQEYIQNGNMYRDDGSFVTTAKHYNEVKEFNGSSFNSNGKFILICAGGEGIETGGGGGEDNPPVEQKTLSSITASLTGTYDTNNNISDVTSHITVTAHYSDSTTATVTGTFDTSNVVMSTAGTYNIGVSYTEGGVTKTTSVSVVVAQAGGGEPVEPTKTYVESRCATGKRINAGMIGNHSGDTISYAPVTAGVEYGWDYSGGEEMYFFANTNKDTPCTSVAQPYTPSSNGYIGINSPNDVCIDIRVYHY